MPMTPVRRRAMDAGPPKRYSVLMRTFRLVPTNASGLILVLSASLLLTAAGCTRERPAAPSLIRLARKDRIASVNRSTPHAPDTLSAGRGREKEAPLIWDARSPWFFFDKNVELGKGSFDTKTVLPPAPMVEGGSALRIPPRRGVARIVPVCR